MADDLDEMTDAELALEARELTAMVDDMLSLKEAMSLKDTALGLVLARAKDDSYAGIVKLMEANPENVAGMRLLQQQANRYFELLGYCDAILAEGKEALAGLGDEARAMIVSEEQRRGESGG